MTRTERCLLPLPFTQAFPNKKPGETCER